MPKSYNSLKEAIEIEKQSGCAPMILENKLWKGVMRHCSYIHYVQTLLYLSSDFRLAYAANISEYLTITYSFRTLRGYL